MRTNEQEQKILAEIRERLTPGYLPPHIRGGHDVSHVVRMCAIAEKIADETVDVFLLKLAIWLHNLDRSSYGYPPVRQLLFQYPEITTEETDTIIDAVQKHSKLNNDSDSILLRFFKDCDRLDMGAMGILRIAAHRWDLPPYKASDFEGRPDSTEEKDLKTMVHDLYRCLEWEGFLRTAGAKALAVKRFAFMRRFLNEVERELKELELIG